MKEKDVSKPRKDEKLAREARIACEKWREFFKINIDQYHKMFEFVLGRQWSKDEEDDMIKTFRKVPLVSNKLGVLANFMMGELQQNTPQLQVVPLEECPEEMARLRENITKDIILGTNAAEVYQVAYSQALIGGFGAFLWDTEYKSPMSFELDIVPRYFKDATRCYWDLGAEDINKTDGDVAGYITRIRRPKFRAIYGKKLEEEISKTFSVQQSEEEIALAVQPYPGDDPFNWADEEAITILHHYKRVYDNETIYKLSNGKSVSQEELDEMIEKSSMMNAQMGYGTEMVEGEEMILTLWYEGEPVRIEDRKKVKKHRIMHYQIAGEYVLEGSEFPSDDLPVIFVDQNSHFDKAGKQVCKGFLDDCEDTQRYINYLRTQAAYVLKVSRYDQWVGSKKNVQGADTARNWRDPNAMQGMLTYDESPNGDKPFQIQPPELSRSLTEQYELAMQDLYTSTGLYPAQLGQQGNETSGRAVDSRTRQGSYATQVARTSLNRAISSGGSIVNQMIPRVYDSERVIALITPEEGMKNITINKQADEYGERIENDIRKGTFEVRLKAGPSYEGQKQESLDSLQQVMQADPSSFKLIADLYAENLPLMNTLEIKNRLKTMVPKEVIEAGKTGKMPYEMGADSPSPEQMQVQLQQQQMQMEEQFKQQELMIKKQELAIKERQSQAEIEIEQMKVEIAQMELAGNVEEAKLRYMAETQRTESDYAISHADNLVKVLIHKEKSKEV